LLLRKIPVENRNLIKARRLIMTVAFGSEVFQRNKLICLRLKALHKKYISDYTSCKQYFSSLEKFIVAISQYNYWIAVGLYYLRNNLVKSILYRLYYQIKEYVKNVCKLNF